MKALPKACPHGRRVRGVSLIFALIALAALSLSALALIRSVDTGTLMLGNLGFKQDATASADRATQMAIDYLNGFQTGAGSYNNKEGYYAAYVDHLDATGGQMGGDTRKLIDWDGDNCASAGAGDCTLVPKEVEDKNMTEYKASYIILRLCVAEGDPNKTTCIKPLNDNLGGGSAGVIDRGRNQSSVVPTMPYYRIITRVVGARDTTSYTETIVRF